jgi:hypothetical protein
VALGRFVFSDQFSLVLHPHSSINISINQQRSTINQSLTQLRNMKPFSLPSIIIAFVFATSMSIRGIKRNALTKEGAMCAFVVGFSSLACGLRGFLLLLFYVVSNHIAGEM